MEVIELESSMWYCPLMDCSAVIEKIQNSIAKIYCFDADSKMMGTGSGFLFSKKGVLITCDHVIDGSQSILCQFPNDEEYYVAKIVIRDAEHDIAVLKVENVNKAILPMGKQENVKAGMPVIFSGYPLSLNTLTTHQGILSAITTDAVGITTYLIDGTVNPGNSGCPLMTYDGEVIGMVNATARKRSDILNKVEKMSLGAISIHGVDLVDMYQAMITNMQLGVGYAIPVSYIPEHKELKTSPKAEPKTPKSRK